MSVFSIDKLVIPVALGIIIAMGFAAWYYDSIAMWISTFSFAVFVVCIGLSKNTSSSNNPRSSYSQPFLGIGLGSLAISALTFLLFLIDVSYK